MNDMNGECPENAEMKKKKMKMMKMKMNATVMKEKISESLSV